MRCDPCKIRFLKVPWFIGHLVRCPRWKENSKDVIDYFSAVSKRKLVIMRRPNRKEEKNPPTCFTCFCGKTFLSPTLHTAHLQQCVSKVLSSKPNLTMAQVKPAKQPKAMSNPQEDEGVTIQMIPGSQDKSNESIELEEVTIHEGREVNAGQLDTESEAVQPVNIHRKDNLVVVVKQTDIKEDQNESMSHEESLEVLQREIMHEDALEGQELDDTVMQLEYFEDEQHDDPQVANEVEVGTYEEVSSYVDEERIHRKRTSPGVTLPKNTGRTLVIETAVCDCGKKCRNAEDLTNHLKFCSYYGKSPQKRPEKRVVLITCVCKAQFTKVDIKEHLLSCETWRYVKRKKNLDRSPGNLEGRPIKQELFEETYSVEDVGHHESDIHGEIEEEPTSPVECYEQEVVTQTDDLIEESVSSPLNESSQSDVQIGEIVTISDETSEDNSPRASMQVRSPTSSNDHPEATFAVEIPKVTFRCECGAIFRHANVYQLHQASCDKHLTAHGKDAKDTEDKTSLDRSSKKKDVVFKYSGPMRGEILKKCYCGHVIDSIFNYRQHTANCPAFSKARLPSARSKIQVQATPKRPPSISETKRCAKDCSSEDSQLAPGSLKKSKVELCDELKDFVKLPDPEKPEALRTKRKK